MPPKKKSRLIDGQRKLTSSLFSSGPRQLTETPGVEIDKQVEIDVDKGAKLSSSSNLVNTRSFLHTWTKTYSWLRYDQNDGFMFCEVWTGKKKKNGLTKDVKCRNFQNSTLTRHAALQEHQMALQNPQLGLPEHFRAAQDKADSQQDKAVSVLLKIVHWLCVEGLPMSKFKSLLELLHDLNVPDISILKNGKINYDSYSTYDDMLDCLSEVIEDDLKVRLSKSPVVTVLADESTDIANVKRLDIYAQPVYELRALST